MINSRHAELFGQLGGAIDIISKEHGVNAGGWIYSGLENVPYAVLGFKRNVPFSSRFVLGEVIDVRIGLPDIHPKYLFVDYVISSAGAETKIWLPREPELSEDSEDNKPWIARTTGHMSNFEEQLLQAQTELSCTDSSPEFGLKMSVIADELAGLLSRAFDLRQYAAPGLTTSKYE